MLKDRIKKLRIKNHLTQDALAEKLYVSRTLVAKWETGKRYPTSETLMELSKIFNISYEELLSDDEEIYASQNELGECVPDGEDTQDIDANDFLVKLLANKISSFLRGIPDNDRKIFIRRYYYYEKSESIAGKMNLSVDDVRTSLSETRNKLLAELMKN